MKFELTMKPGATELRLTPESDAEAQLLAAMSPWDKAEEEAELRSAKVQAEYDSQRPPYKRCLALKVTL